MINYPSLLSVNNFEVNGSGTADSSSSSESFSATVLAFPLVNSVAFPIPSISCRFGFEAPSGCLKFMIFFLRMRIVVFYSEISIQCVPVVVRPL